MTSLDLKCRQVLMSAYLYYQRNTQVLSDHENDRLCIDVAANYEMVPLRYKPLLAPFDITGESLVYTSHQCRYTRLVETGALAWLFEKKNEVLEPLGHGYYEGKELESDMQLWELM